MNGIQFLSNVIRGVWAIDEEAAQSYLPLLANVINNKVELEQNLEKHAVFAIGNVESKQNTAFYSRWNKFNDAPEGSVAVIGLSGPLMKHDQSCGPRGMNSIGDIIKEADAHQNISAIVLRIDSPGGTVDGTENLASVVKNTQKPVVAFVDGMMASAALWIGSSADEIIASNDMDRIGSIGVMMSFADVQPALEEMGVKFHTILADQSKDKNRIMEDVRKGEYKEYRETILNPLAERFIAAAKNNREALEEKHTSGSMFFAKDVIGTLIDSVGSFEEAIDRAIELANEQNSTNNQSHTSMKQFEHVNAALGVENLESADNTVALNEQQLEALDNALGTQAAQKAELETANQAKEDAEAKVATLEAENAELKQKPAADRSTTVVENDDKEKPAFEAALSKEDVELFEKL